MKQFSVSQPRPFISASANLMPARIFSAVMPGGSAGSEKSTVAGSRPTSRTRFIRHPPKAQRSDQRDSARPPKYNSRRARLMLFAGSESVKHCGAIAVRHLLQRPFREANDRNRKNASPVSNGGLWSIWDDHLESSGYLRGVTI